MPPAPSEIDSVMAFRPAAACNSVAQGDTLITNAHSPRCAASASACRSPLLRIHLYSPTAQTKFLQLVYVSEQQPNTGFAGCASLHWGLQVQALTGDPAHPRILNPQEPEVAQDSWITETVAVSTTNKFWLTDPAGTPGNGAQAEGQIG